MMSVGLPPIILIFIFVISVGINGVHSASVILPKRLGVLGKNPVTIECITKLESNETLSSVALSRKRKSDTAYEVIAEEDASGNVTYPSHGGDSRLHVTADEKALSVKFKAVECGDEASYRCTMKYSKGGLSLNCSDTMYFSVQAVPLKPISLKMIPAHRDHFEEQQKITFTCSGNVGRPPGWFWWFVHRVDAVVNKTDDAKQNNEYPVEGPSACTFMRTSALTLTVTRYDDGAVVRCQVYNPVLEKDVNFTQCSKRSDLCLETKKLTVRHEKLPDITVWSSPPGPNILIRTSVTLNCSSPLSPSPSYSWLHVDTNEHFSGPTVFRVSLSTRTDGTYICTATHNISGVIRTVTATLKLRVVNRTVVKATFTKEMVNFSCSVVKTDEYSSFTIDKLVLMSVSGGPLVTAKPTKNGGKAYLSKSSLASRATVVGFVNNSRITDSFLQLLLTSPACSDSGAYICGLQLVTSEDNYAFYTDIKHIGVPVAPDTSYSTLMKIIGDYTDFSEGAELVFTCWGHVGSHPAGWFWWFIVNGDNETNITVNAMTETPVSATGGCGFYRMSNVSVRVTYELKGSRLRCAVYHPIYLIPDRTCNNACAESDQLFMDTLNPKQLAGGNAGIIAIPVIICLIAIAVPAAWVYWKRNKPMSPDEQGVKDKMKDKDDKTVENAAIWDENVAE